MEHEVFVSNKELYRKGDMIKYEYLPGDFSTGKVLELHQHKVKIEIGLPYSKRSDIYTDILEVEYDKIIPYERYERLYKDNDN